MIDEAPSTKQILFLGFVAPEMTLDQAFAQERAPQVSAAKFQISFLGGLVRIGTTIEALSALPIASFPKSRIKFVRSSVFQMFDGKLHGYLIGGVNFPIFKLAIRLIKALLHGHKIVRTSSAEAIVVYSLHTPFLLTALYLKRVTGLPAAVFIPDLPMHMHGRTPTGLHGALKRADNALLKKLVRGFDLALPFTKGIGEDWLPSEVKFQVVDGIAPPTDQPAVPYRMQNSERPKLLYTGSFTKVARFAKLFSSCPDIVAELIFAGDGADRDELKRIAEEDSRIRILPFVAEAELRTLIAQADFLLNPRDSRWEGGRYSFPSKLLDYAFRSKPVISTRLPGIDEAYFDHFLPVEDTDAESLRASLLAAISVAEDQLAKRVVSTRLFCEQKNSAEAVAANVLQGLEDL